MAIKVHSLTSGTRLNGQDVYKQYSTTEQFTGEYWVDNKKIYEVFVGGTVGTIQNLINNISNVNEFLELRGQALSNYGQKWPIPNVHVETGYNINYFFSANKVTLGFGSYYSSNNTAWALVRYTKTT